MSEKEKLTLKKVVLEISSIVVGALIMAFAVSQFLLPNQLSSGGLTGVATIFYYLFHFPMGTTILVLNIPLFILALYKLGKYFFMKSFIGTILLSVFIDVLDIFEPLTDDRFLACIYGGILIGLRNSDYIKSKWLDRWNRLNKLYCKRI